MGFLRIPRNRIIDAAPVALVLILLSLVWFVPAGVPLSMLHIWLWLRHPRPTSRYVIVAGVLLLYLGIFSLMPMVAYWLTPKNALTTVPISTSGVATPLMISASAGILPIIYRLLSRRSLVYRDDESENDSLSETRAGISDLMVLSLLCAIVFVVARIPESAIDWRYAPALDLLTTLVFSAAGILAMQLCGSRSGSLNIPTAIGLWFVSWGAMWLTIWFSVHAWEHWLDQAQWLDPGSTYWGVRNQFFGLGIGLLMLYPEVCRRCGVTLQKNEPLRTASEAIASTAESEHAAPTRQRSRFTKSRVFAGSFLGLCAISAFTLVPFVQLDQAGYRIAGWPLVYWEQDQIASTDQFWFWTESDIWETVRFRWTALLADLGVTAVLWMTLFSIPFVPHLVADSRRRLIQGLVIATVALGFIGQYYIYPPYLASQVDQDGVFIIDHSEPRVGRVGFLAETFDETFLDYGTVNRSKISGVRFSDVEPGVISRVLGMTQLSELVIEDCELQWEHIEQIVAQERLWKLQIDNCRVPPKTDEALLKKPALIKLAIRQFDPQGNGVAETRSYYRNQYDLQLHWTSGGGEFHVPDGVNVLQVSLPTMGTGRYQIRGQDVQEVTILDDDVVEPATQYPELKISNAPKLENVFCDQERPIMLYIENAPLLDTIDGSSYFASSKGAPLRSLEISGKHRLSFLAVDVTSCLGLDVSFDDSPPVPIDLRLYGTRIGNDGYVTRIPPERSRKLLAPLLSPAAFSHVSLTGFTLDSDLLASMSQADSLALAECRIDPSAFQASPDFLDSLTLFRDVDFHPDEETLETILDAMNGSGFVQIGGDNLDRLPDAPIGTRLVINGGPTLFFQASDLKPFSQLTVGPDSLANEFSPRGVADSDYRFQGRVANDKNVVALVRRLVGVEAPDLSRVTIESPQASRDAFRDITWHRTVELILRNSDVDDEVVASWKLPEVQHIDLSDTRVTLDVIETLVENCPKLRHITLNNVDTSARIPDLSKLPVGFNLTLQGRTITAADIEQFEAVDLGEIDLRNCEIDRPIILQLRWNPEIKAIYLLN